MKAIGKMMQFVGLVILPASILMEITGQLNRDSGVSQMVIMMVFGAVIFYFGRVVEGYARS